MPDFNNIFDFLSNYGSLFGFPRELIQGSAIIYNLLIPSALLIFAVKLAFDQIKIFRSGTVNWGLSFIVSFSTVIFAKNIGVINFILPMVSIAFISMFTLHGVKGIFLGFILAVVYGFVLYPFMVAYIR